MAKIKYLPTILIVSLASHATAKTLDSSQLANIFKKYNACFMLFNQTSNKLELEYNPNNRCNQRISPNSTFKIPLSVMAFNQKLIIESTVFNWDGKAKWLPEWNKDQTPETWEKYSVVWVSQQLTPKLGLDTINKYLLEFNYGNRDFSGDPGKNNGLTNAWLSGSLKISAVEQLKFLKAMNNYSLAVSKSSIDNTKNNIYLGKLDNSMRLYGKTGSGWQQRSESNNQGKLRDGWFIGYLQSGKQQYIFVTNITDKKSAKNSNQMGGAIAKELTLKILNNYLY